MHEEEVTLWRTPYLIITYPPTFSFFFNRFVGTSLSSVHNGLWSFQPIIIVSSSCAMRSQHASILFYDRSFIICFISCSRNGWRLYYAHIRFTHFWITIYDPFLRYIIIMLRVRRGRLRHDANSWQTKLYHPFYSKRLI